MFSYLIPALIITPLLFAMLAFVFYKRASSIALIFALLFFMQTLSMLYGVSLGETSRYLFGAWQTPLGIAFEASAFGSAILALSAFILLISFIYAHFSLSQEQSRLFYVLSIFLSLGFVVIYLSRDLFNIYVGLEIVGLSAVALTALQKGLKTLHASLVYLFSTLVGSGLYLLGVAIIYAKYRLLDIDALAMVVQNESVTMVAFGIMTLAFLLKTAIFPLSFWLANAHANALSVVSVLLSALVIKSTFYLLYLFGTTLFIFSFTEALAYLGVIAIFYGGIKALLAKELKRLIAYSTISQVGYLLLIFAFSKELSSDDTYTQYAYYAMAFALFSHALAKSGFFLAAGVMIHLKGTKEIAAFSGFASITPVSVFAIGLSALSLIGLPPSLGFVSKWYYLQSAYLSESWFFLAAILAGGILTALYLFRLLILFLEHPTESAPTLTKADRVMEWSAFVLSSLSILAAFFSDTIIEFLGIKFLGVS